MKKSILLILITLLSVSFLVGCSGEQVDVDQEEVIFNEDEFKRELLEIFESNAALNVEGRFTVGYMYAEAFSTDEYGTFTKGNLQLSGRAFDPSDMGDETILNGRTYTKSTTSSGNLDLVLSNGSRMSNFYSRYFIPLEYDWNLYSYEDVEDEKGKIILDETKVRNEIENGNKVFVHEYTYIELMGNKNDSNIISGVINKLIVKSFFDISANMDEFIETEFGNKYQLADQINQTLGDDFLNGIYAIEEFKAEYK